MSERINFASGGGHRELKIPLTAGCQPAFGTLLQPSEKANWLLSPFWLARLCLHGRQVNKAVMRVLPLHFGHRIWLIDFPDEVRASLFLLRGPDFLPPVNALSALYPMNGERERLIEALLLAVPRYYLEGRPNMVDQELLKRITADPEIFGGKPIIRGMRISVELILSLLAQGETTESILSDYPDLEPDDIRACLAYAHAVVAHDRLDDIQITSR